MLGDPYHNLLVACTEEIAKENVANKLSASGLLFSRRRILPTTPFRKGIGRRHKVSPAGLPFVQVLVEYSLS